jgi:tetratricopeptide (TPR) repeat protein
MLLATGLGAAGLMVVMLLGNAAAIVYRIGTDAAGEERWPEAYAALRGAVALDPWQPTGPKSLAVAADRLGRSAEARAAAQRAVELGPGDGPSWTNLALLCLAAGDNECARAAAGRAVDTAGAAGRELANAALVYESLGDQEAADRTYRLSLLTNYWTGLTLPWPRHVSVGDGGSSELGVDVAEFNLLIARRLSGEPVQPDDYAGPVTRALAMAMTGDREAALGEIARARRVASSSATTWDISVLLAEHYGDDPRPFARIGEVVRGARLGTGPSRPAFLIFDIATFRAYPADGLVGAATRLLPDIPWPSVLKPLLAP